MYIDDTINDIHYLFNETRGYWHYVAASYTRLFQREVRLQIYLDNIKVLDSRIFDWHNFRPTNSYNLHIGRKFPGIVRKAKVNARSYIGGQSLWINTDASKCIQKGTSKCSFCDLDESTGSGTYNCFATCVDFGNYFDGSSCQSSHISCRYCKSSPSLSDCYL